MDFLFFAWPLARIQSESTLVLVCIPIYSFTLFMIDCLYLSFLFLGIPTLLLFLLFCSHFLPLFLYILPLSFYVPFFCPHYLILFYFFFFSTNTLSSVYLLGHIISNTSFVHDTTILFFLHTLGISFTRDTILVVTKNYFLFFFCNILCPTFKVGQ